MIRGVWFSALARETVSAVGVALLKQIPRLMYLDWEARVIHILHEANCYVDGLTNLGSELNVLEVVFDSPPGRITEILCDDSRGLAFPRLVTV